MHSDKIWIWSEYYYSSINHVYKLTECSWPSELYVFLKFLVHTLLMSIMLFDVLISGTKLHFTTLESGECVPSINVTIAVVWSVQVWTEAAVVPPSCTMGLSTVSWMVIIIPVRCWELHTFKVTIWATSTRPITSCSGVVTKIQSVLVGSIVNSNEAVDGIFVYSFVVGHVNSQLGSTNTECQAVDLLQSKPMFIQWISKSFFVMDPVAIEIQLSMPSLEHNPLSIAHITRNIKWFQVITSRVNSVDSILSTSSLIDLLTVPRYGIPRWCTWEWSEYTNLTSTCSCCMIFLVCSPSS